MLESARAPHDQGPSRFEMTQIQARIPKIGQIQPKSRNPEIGQMGQIQAQNLRDRAKMAQNEPNPGRNRANPGLEHPIQGKNRPQMAQIQAQIPKIGPKWPKSRSRTPKIGQKQAQNPSEYAQRGPRERDVKQFRPAQFHLLQTRSQVNLRKSLLSKWFYLLKKIKPF